MAVTARKAFDISSRTFAKKSFHQDTERFGILSHRKEVEWEIKWGLVLCISQGLGIAAQIRNLDPSSTTQASVSTPSLVIIPARPPNEKSEGEMLFPVLWRLGSFCCSSGGYFIINFPYTWPWFYSLSPRCFCLQRWACKTLLCRAVKVLGGYLRNSPAHAWALPQARAAVGHPCSMSVLAASTLGRGKRWGRKQDSSGGLYTSARQLGEESRTGCSLGQVSSQLCVSRGAAAPHESPLDQVLQPWQALGSHGSSLGLPWVLPWPAGLLSQPACLIRG